MSYDYEYIIVGAGVSGLYAGWRLERDLGITNYLVLEREPVTGGRNRQEDFHGAVIQLGAGVMRPRYDTHLMRLVKTLGLSYQEVDKTMAFNLPGYQGKTWYNHVLDTLPITDKETFGETVHRYFQGNRKSLKRFRQESIYTDFFRSTTATTLRHYPKADMRHGTPRHYAFLDGGYHVLCKALEAKLRKGKIMVGQTVVSITKKSKIYHIAVAGGRVFTTANVICTVPIDALRKIRFHPRSVPIDEVRRCVGYNPFLRMYTHHDKVNVPGSIVTSTAFKQIHPISGNVLMSAYSDNRNAFKARKIIESSDNERLTGLINTALSPSGGDVSPVKDRRVIFWEAGTHFYKPGCSPSVNYVIAGPGLYLCGEIVAFEQGWTEGSIHSVDALMDRLLEEEKKIKIKGK
jgi:glycine/D-amino acid oxidase-like deaminating enzyme